MIAHGGGSCYFATILVAFPSLTKEPVVKKIVLGLLAAITIASGATLLSAQALEPCSPIPNGCKVTKGCSCSGGVCSDEYQCGPILPT